MTSFILRKLDPEFWQRVRAKAVAEGTSVKEVILRLLTAWLAAVLLLTLSAGCAYHLPSEPTPATVAVDNTPVSIQLLASSRSNTVIDVAAKVFTRDGRFLQDVAVTFTALPGLVVPDTAVTDRAGVAHTVVTVTVGVSLVQATAGTLSASITVP